MALKNPSNVQNLTKGTIYRFKKPARLPWWLEQNYEQKFSWLFRYVVLTSMVEPQKVPMAAADDHVVRLQPLQNVGKPSAALAFQMDPDRHIVRCTSFLTESRISKPQITILPLSG